MKAYKIKLTIHSDGHKIYEYRETWYTKLITFIRENFSKSHKIEPDKENLYEYMKEEWRKTNPSYLKYFDLWFNNTTEQQQLAMSVWMDKKLGPFV